MTKENLNQGSEDESKLNNGSDSEDAGDFESLFADDEEQEDEGEDKIARLEKQVSDMKKGMSKFFSQKGRETKSKDDGTKNTNKENGKSDISDIEEMFFEQKPEAELVGEDLKQIAKAKGVSILKAWRDEKWLQDKASALAKAKKEEEEAKSKIDSPSGHIKKGAEDFDSLTNERISDLSASEWENYRNWRLNKEKLNKEKKN